MNGRDLAIAALLGAEEFGFSTAPLVVLGCIMMRVCQLDTCPVGVATQNPELRKKFMGDPSHVANYMLFVAKEFREIMAQLGFRTVTEMVGRVDRLQTKDLIDHYKLKGIDLRPLLHQMEVPQDAARYNTQQQDHKLEESLDMQHLLTLAQPAIDSGEQVRATLPITNINRVVGTIVGSEVTRKYGAEGLPEDTISFHFVGSAGQSFGAFVPKGITLSLEGDSNDYVGKGLSGGKIIVAPSPKATFNANENVIIGNTAFYGATNGEAFISGIAGERFAVRNSGVKVVVEGVGDHGCEYMTGGRVAILGGTGRNFAAGMSGGVAYVLDEAGDFYKHCNIEMVLLERVEETRDVEELHDMIKRHVAYTGSAIGDRLLSDWESSLTKFVKVIPKDYKRMLEQIEKMEQSGLEGDAALLAAFEANMKELARVGGN
jgi:glutamate synthase (NADPH) large chain